MMSGAIAALTVLAGTLCPAFPMAPSGVELQYRRPLGQVAEYRLLLEVSGEQISLGERRPVRVTAELALTEEAIAQGRNGTMWLRVGARPVKVEDAAGLFGARGRGQWPFLHVSIDPRGEVLGVSPATGEHRAGMRERAFVSLMAQPAPVILPPARVAPGEEWEWASAGARQQNRLVEVRGEGAAQIARIASRGRSPLELREESDSLGLATRLSGDATQESELELLVACGLAARHKGRVQMQTNSQVMLALPEGPREFEMKSDLYIKFDLRLVRVDGEPVDLR